MKKRKGVEMKIMHATFSLFFSFLCCVFSNVSAKKIYTGKETVSLIKTIESTNSFISYVMINGSFYIIKQKKNAERQFSVVRDALAAYIAKDLGIAHKVEIISPTENCSGKIYSMRPGALLTIARGAIISSQQESKYYNLCLKQRTVSDDLLPHRWLNEKIIYQITWHKQLPIIIGLDLFICNTDRHGGNLFYDPDTDSFCAIDMDNIFRRDLPALACEKLNIMIKERKSFTREEIEALISVRNTIQFLLDKYPPKRLIEQLHLFIKQAGFEEGGTLYTEKIARKIARHERVIIESRASALRLIEILNKIINRF